MSNSGPLRRLMLLAGACRAWDWPVMMLMLSTIWEAVIWAQTEVKRVAPAAIAPKALVKSILKMMELRLVELES